MSDWLMRYFYTFCNVFSFGDKPTVDNLDGYLIGRWCSLAIVISLVVFVLTVIWPIIKKRQFSIVAIILTTIYVAIWVWLLKTPNPTAEYDLPLAVLLTLF